MANEKMSVRARIEDALLLWQNGRKHGAWIQVLIAAAATSRIRFPRPATDREAFTAFIREVTPTIFDSKRPAISGGVTVVLYDRVPQEGVHLDHVFYTHLRCNLVHEAILPSEVELCNSTISGDGTMASNFGGKGSAESPVKIPDFWVLNLAKAVAEAPENATACAGLFTTTDTGFQINWQPR
jgi:hypothetical protein